MASKKVSELTELLALASGDIFVVNDASETDVTKITKKLPYSTLLAAIVAAVADPDYVSVYDVVVRTPGEFEALIADSTWFDAVSVAFIGQFTLSTANNSGIKIPSTVKQIHGFNGAKITITNFLYNGTTAKGGLWYNTRPTTNDYVIRNLEVNCTGSSTIYGFYNIYSLMHCIANVETTTGNSYGFSACRNLINCKANVAGNGLYVRGFTSCEYIINCISSGALEGFQNCKYINNSIADARLIGFLNCETINNALAIANGIPESRSSAYGFDGCRALSNCIGSGQSAGVGYSFNNCSYANGCREDTTRPSTTAIWGGSNTKIDYDSCDQNA